MNYFERPDQVVTGIVLAVLVGLVIIGGIKRIGSVGGQAWCRLCAVLYMLERDRGARSINVSADPGVCSA